MTKKSGIISATDLYFEYPDKRALNDVSFHIGEGNITALVGPNGAGKTTLLRCLAGLEQPFSGHCHIMGLHVQQNPRKVHEKMGYLSDFFGLYNDLTIEQCLTYTAWSHHIPQNKVKMAVNQAIERLGLEEYRTKKAGGLSRGWRQRLGIAQVIIHNPKVLLLDEPASGLDPEARSSLSELVIQLKNEGMTIMVSSHILAELEDYCTDMLVIREGSIVDHVTLDDFQSEDTTTLIIKVTEGSERYVEQISSYQNVSHVEHKENTVVCSFNGGKSDQSEFLSYLIQNNIPVFGFSEKPRTLAGKYLELAETQKEKAS